MVNYLTIVTHQGRLFINPPQPEQDGLIAVVDYKQKNKPIQPQSIAFNATGDSFLISDSRGQVTLYLLQNNRYCTIAADLKGGAPPCVSFTGKLPQDQVFVASKDKNLQVHSLNGKLLEKFQSWGNHKTEVKFSDINTKMGLLLTLSSDVCILWSNNQNQSLLKQRSLFAKDGVNFNFARFTSDGSKIATLFKDGEFILWSLDTQEIDSKSVKFNFRTQLITQFDMGLNFIAASGPYCPYIVIRNLSGPLKDQEEYYKLPAGQRGIDSMKLLRDKNLLAYLSEGYFYIVDLSSRLSDPKSKSESDLQPRIKVKLNIRIPNEAIKNFDVDFNMNTVLLGTNNGNVYMYDLPKALENERFINKKRLDVGVEEELVFTFLDKVSEQNFNDQIFQGQSQMSEIQSTTKIFNDQASFVQTIVQQQQQNSEIYSQQFDQAQQQQNRHALSTINPFSTRTIGDFQFSQIGNTNRNLQTVSQKDIPIVQSSTMKNTVAFSEKDGYLNAGVPSIISKGPRQNASLNKTSKSIMNNSNISQTQQQSVISVLSQQQQMVIDENFQPEFKFTQSTITQSQMTQFNLPKLKQMLKQFGEFPEKYRALTWKYLLDLPLNKEAYQNLMRRGVHPVFKNLHKKYPISSYRLYNKLVRTLSALGYWCPIFLDVEYFPSIVFPFIKSIPNDDLMVFETVLAIIVQWMQTWFEGYPSEPLTVLQAVETILEREDPKLVSFFRMNSFSSSLYSWPLIQNFFTEILTKDDWLRLCDHLFTYKEDPELVIYFCAAFLLTSKGQIQQIQSIDELHAFTSRTTGIAFKKIINLTFKLHSKYKEEILTGNISQSLPLQQKSLTEYPLFTRYPEYVVTYQARMREKILMEEDEIKKKESLLIELKQKAEEIVVQEERFRKQQESSLRAETDRKLRIQQEQEQMLQERIRLDELTRIAKLEHIKRLEEALQNGIHYQEEIKKQEAKALEEEFDQRQRAQKYEYEARMQDELIANMEFKANQKLLEMMQKRTSEEAQKKLKAEFEQRQKEEEQRDRILQERWRLEDQEQRLKSELLKQTLTQQAQDMQINAERAKIEQRMRLQEYEKEMQLLKIEEQRRLRQMEEELILRKQQMLEEMRKKSETMQSIEAQKLWDKLNQDREIERLKAEERMKTLEIERSRLEQAIDREREEQERLEQTERQRDLEKDVQSIYSSQMKNADEERDQIERMQKQMAQDREEAEIRRIEMMRKEQEIRESKDFMQYIKNTEGFINQVVERGQQNQEFRRLQGGQSEYEERKRAEYESRMRKHVEDRERQLKEYNDQQLYRLQEERSRFEKENIPDNSLTSNPYLGQQQQQPWSAAGSIDRGVGKTDQSYDQYQRQTGFSGYGQPSQYNNYQQQQQQDPRFYSGSPNSQAHDQQFSPGGNQYSAAKESSLSESSHGTEALIKKHYDTKQAFQDYKNSQQTIQGGVFSYNNPYMNQPPVGQQNLGQIGQTTISSYPGLQPTTTQSNFHYTQKTESYLSSSSSSGEEDDDLESSLSSANHQQNPSAKQGRIPSNRNAGAAQDYQYLDNVQPEQEERRSHQGSRSEDSYYSSYISSNMTSSVQSSHRQEAPAGRK